MVISSNVLQHALDVELELELEVEVEVEEVLLLLLLHVVSTTMAVAIEIEGIGKNDAGADEVVEVVRTSKALVSRRGDDHVDCRPIEGCTDSSSSARMFFMMLVSRSARRGFCGRAAGAGLCGWHVCLLSVCLCKKDLWHTAHMKARWRRCTARMCTLRLCSFSQSWVSEKYDRDT